MIQITTKTQIVALKKNQQIIRKIAMTGYELTSTLTVISNRNGKTIMRIDEDGTMVHGINFGFGHVKWFVV